MTRRNVLKGARLNLCHAVLAVAVTSCLAPIAAYAQSMETQATFHIPAGDLASAVDAFSRQSGLQILYRPALLGGKRAKSISGSLTNAEALERLLKGSGIEWERVNGSTYVLKESKKTKKEEPVATPPISNPATSKQAEEVAELEKIVVVGSRLGTSPVESAMPIRLISRDQIDRSGAGSIAQVLSYLSEVSLNNAGDRSIGSNDAIGGGGNTNSTTVQLRGLTKGSVLILINGRRAGSAAAYSDTGQFDLSTVPISLVERIEILPAGSSAVYGGDGLAGVVNIVLRRDANGVEFRYRKAATDGYSTDQATAMLGRNWSRGSLSLAATWSEAEDLLSSERRLTANQDFRRFGGGDFRTTWANPPTVYSVNGCPSTGYCFVPISSRGNLPGLSSPIAVVPADSNGTGLSPSDFVETQGIENRSSEARHLRSSERNFGVTANGILNLGSSVELFVEGAYTNREVPALEVPLFSSSANYSEPISIVPASNPFNPFGVSVAVGYRFNNTGIFTTYGQKHMRGVLGARGQHGRFDWEVAVNRSIDRAESAGSMGYNAEAIRLALTSTDASNALNPFITDGRAPASIEVMRSIADQGRSNSKNEIEGLTAFIKGRIGTLPMGKVIGLFGIEAQKNSYDWSTNVQAAAVRSISGSRSNKAAFAEVRAPILSSTVDERLGRIVLTGAYRAEKSDGFEETAITETIGLEGRPSEELLLRATYSTAFRPILAHFDLQDPRFRNQVVADPRFNNQVFSVPVRTGGGHPEKLLPEKSNNSTLGLLYRPNDALTLGLTHWNVDFYDRISYIPAQSILTNEGVYPGRVLRDQQSGVVQEIDARQVNIALMSAAGIDIDIGKSWSTSKALIQAGLAATYTYKHEERQAKGLPVENGVAQHRSETWAPRWKLVPRLIWEMPGRATVMITGRYVSGYRDSLPLQVGQNAGSYQNLGDFWLADLNVDLPIGELLKGTKFLSRANINFGAVNLFNRLPEFCAGCTASGYDSSQYDIIGRSLHAELRFSF